MQLIDDQVAELRRLPALIVPRIRGRIAHHAEAVGKRRGDGQLAGEGVALPADAALAVDEKHVGLAVAYSGDEPAPAAIAQWRQRILLLRPPVWRLRRGKPRTGDDEHGAGVRRPGAEAGAVGPGRGAHGAGPADPGLVHGHANPRRERSSARHPALDWPA